MTESHSKVQYIQGDEISSGQRIDNFLFRNFRKVPKTRIYRGIRKGEVRVNKKRVSADYRIEVGDVIRIPPLVTPGKNIIIPSKRSQNWVKDTILTENDGLIIVNKPSGMAVHGGSGLNGGFIEAFRVANPQYRYLELVHRLDKGTSGCLVIAKKPSVLKHCHTQLREGGMTKQYLALTKGHWENAHEVVTEPLHKFVKKSGERIVQVRQDGKLAKSVFDTIETYSCASLVRVSLLTGRTHQIRVHSAHRGHPIAGDDKYGENEFNKAMAKIGLNRLFLHAELLKFTMPNGEKLEVTAPLDPGLKEILAGL